MAWVYAQLGISHNNHFNITTSHLIMTTRILSLFTRTPLHIGAGASVGAIDQPIIRERHTGFPYIPGSAIKGVIADLFLNNDKRTAEGEALLGKEDASQAGTIAFGEGKLLAFPVRSAKGCFAWVTSPMVLRRWMRDCNLTGEIPQPEGSLVYAPMALQTEQNQVLLEGYLLDAAPLPSSLVPLLSKACADPMWSELLPHHLLVSSDELLSHFCTSSCEIAQHVAIDDTTGTAKAGALFNQENVPAETLFYAPLTELRSGYLSKLSIPPMLQLGADASTGLGFCSASTM